MLLLKVLSNRRAVEFLQLIAEGRFNVKKIRKTYPKSTIYATLSLLQEAGLIERRGGEYILTTKGEIWENAMRKFSRSFEVLDKILKEFSNCKVSFPDEFLLRLHELEDFKVIPAEELLSIAEKEKLRYVVFEELVEVISDLIPYTILEAVSSKPLLNVRVHLLDRDPELGLLLSENFLAISFPSFDGDLKFLFSESRKAVRFGKSLFKYYKNI